MKSISASHDGIHYRIVGTGPPLVMLHGFADSNEDWFESGYVDGLENIYRLILIDFRGRGESKKDYDPDFYSLDLLADDVQSVVDALEIKEYDLLGYSMGGVIAHWISKKYPGNLKSLVSLDGIVIPDLVNIYKYWAENMEGTLKDYASDPRNLEAKRSRIMNIDIDAIKALSLGLSRSISKYLEEFLSMPNPDYPYLVLVSNWVDQGLDVVEYTNWAKSTTEFKQYHDFDHGDFAYRSDIVIPDLKTFYRSII